MIKQHVLKTAQVNNPIFRSWQQECANVPAFPGLLQKVQGLKDATLASAVLAEDQGNGRKGDDCPPAERLEVFEMDGTQHDLLTPQRPVAGGHVRSRWARSNFRCTS